MVWYNDLRVELLNIEIVQSWLKVKLQTQFSVLMVMFWLGIWIIKHFSTCILQIPKVYDSDSDVGDSLSLNHQAFMVIWNVFFCFQRFGPDSGGGGAGAGGGTSRDSRYLRDMVRELEDGNEQLKQEIKDLNRDLNAEKRAAEKVCCCGFLLLLLLLLLFWVVELSFALHAAELHNAVL